MWEKGNRHRRVRPPLPCVEVLECRELLSVNLGALSGGVTEYPPATGQTYQFSLASPGSIYVATTGAVSLLNAPNHVLASSKTGVIAFTPEPAGIYFVSGLHSASRVFIVAELAGNTRSTAQNLGTIGNASKTAAGWVGNDYRDSYYAFTLAALSSVKIQLTPTLAPPARVAVLDLKGNALSSGAVTSFNQALGPGSYYIHVSQYSPGSHGNFSLNISAAPTVVPTLLNVGVNAQSFVLNDTVSFWANFSQPMIVTGNPVLQFTAGGVTRLARYGYTQDLSVVFLYTVQAGDNAIGLTNAGTILLNGGSIQNAANVPANLSFTPVSCPGTWLVGAPAAVVGITPPASGTYKLGQSLDFVVHFNAQVQVYGNPGLPLNIGTATYLSGSGTNSLTFRYAVATGDSAPAGIGVTGTFTQPGSIGTGDGNAITTLAPVSFPAVVVDGVTANIVRITAPAGGFCLGETMVLNAQFSQAVNVTGTPQMYVSTNNPNALASYSGGSGTATLTFTYVVRAGDATDVVQGGPFLLNGETIITAANGNPASLVSPQSRLNGGSVLVFGSPFSILNILSSYPYTEAFTTGQTIDLIAAFNSQPSVSGTPELALNIGGVIRYATCAGVRPDSLTQLTFTYIVQAGDSRTNGITLVGPLILNGGTITDTAGTGAALGFTDVVLPQLTILQPTAESALVLTPPVGTYIAGQALDFTIEFSQPVNVTGQPQLQIQFPGGTTAQAAYTAGSGTSVLTFVYVVQPTDNYVALLPTALLQLNGGTINNFDNSPAPLTLAITESSEYYQIVMIGG